MAQHILAGRISFRRASSSDLVGEHFFFYWIQLKMYCIFTVFNTMHSQGIEPMISQATETELRKF